jgi:hypothetical protein
MSAPSELGKAHGFISVCWLALHLVIQFVLKERAFYLEKQCTQSC